MFEAVEVFEEEEPGGLLGVIELGGATGLFAEDVVDVSEGLLKHESGGWGRREKTTRDAGREGPDRSRGVVKSHGFRSAWGD